MGILSLLLIVGLLSQMIVSIVFYVHFQHEMRKLRQIHYQSMIDCIKLSYEAGWDKCAQCWEEEQQVLRTFNGSPISSIAQENLKVIMEDAFIKTKLKKAK